MDERFRFVRDALRDRFTMSELCARYGVSRRIGYKWLARNDAEGRRGLSLLSRTAGISAASSWTIARSASNADA